MSLTTAYLLLVASIIMELIATSCLTATKGFTVLKPSIICFCGYFASYILFGFVLVKIDLGITYATWGAAGMVVTSLVGYLYYKQKLTKIGVAALMLVILSTITLNLWGSA